MVRLLGRLGSELALCCPVWASCAPRRLLGYWLEERCVHAMEQMSVTVLGWKRKSSMNQDGQGSHPQAGGASTEPSDVIDRGFSSGKMRFEGGS